MTVANMFFVIAFVFMDTKKKFNIEPYGVWLSLPHSNGLDGVSL